MDYEIFTGEVFPEVVFKKKFDKIITIEFDILFRDVFSQKLCEFCISNCISDVEIESLDKSFPFNEKFSFDQIESKYINFLKQRLNNEEDKTFWNYYMLVTDFVIFSKQSQFGIYASRDFDVGILACEKDINIGMFKELALNIPLRLGFHEMQFNNIMSDKVANQFTGKEYFFVN